MSRSSRKISDTPDGSNEQKFEEIIRFLFTDLSTSETTNFFPALWALAIHDESVARKMHSIYKTERDYLAESIASLRPDLSRKDIDLLAVFASASIEGHTLYIGHRYDRQSSTMEIANMAVRCIIDLVRRFEPEQAPL
ncbi:MAG: TetR family transcriptional regulator C-terminal domain-containing protein [Parvularculaceae bacterium]